jgi:NADPH:quinone reductase
VMGAAGALGSFGVQIARLLGGKVIAAAGADERVAAAVSYGAVAGVNYRQQDLTEEVLRITGGYGVDVVFENISDPVLWPRAFACLATHGRLVTAGAHGGGQVMLDARRLYLKRLQVIGSAGANRSDVEAALAASTKGHLRAAIGLQLPLREAAHAHDLLDRNAVLGKIILLP